MRRRHDESVRMGDVQWVEDVGEYRLSIYLPQLRRGDLQMALRGNQLMISGVRTMGNSWWGMRQMVYRRSFALPGDADPDRISGRLEWGRLRIRIPKYSSRSNSGTTETLENGLTDFENCVRIIGKVVRRGINRILHILKHGL
ncbi:MAG: Hsp20/alpha crystallin family protein [Bacteroidota bacterium]